MFFPQEKEICNWETCTDYILDNIEHNQQHKLRPRQDKTKQDKAKIEAIESIIKL